MVKKNNNKGNNLENLIKSDQEIQDRRDYATKTGNKARISKRINDVRELINKERIGFFTRRQFTILMLLIALGVLIGDLRLFNLI